MKALLASFAVLALLGVTAAEAGSLAPAPRIVTKLERDVLERSGAQTLEEMLDTGIVRYFLTGGQSVLVMVNGRPYATTSSDLDTLPISAIERIELLSGESLGTLGGSAVRGAINVVLRNDLEGFETRTVTRMPSQDGGDGWQGSVFWGGSTGEGRLTLGVDVLNRQEIPARSREYSRSVWPEGGAFNETQNVSVGGNTVWVVQFDDEGNFGGVRSVALGDCDPARGYTGPLTNPPGITSGDKGCGFAYGEIMWNSSSYDQQSLVLNLDHALSESTDLHVDANFTRGDGAFRYAPSIGSFGFRPNADLLDAINDAAGSDFVTDNNDFFVVAHRFVQHGNRDWLWDTGEFDASVGLEGRITENLGYDASISAYQLDGFVDGNTFVHEGRAADEIYAGNYDLENPFSDAPEHLQAIENTSLREEQNFGSDYLGARFALEGSGFAIGGRDAAWTAGVELGTAKSRDVTNYLASDGTTYKVSEVLGSGGVDYAGKRKAAAVFAEMALPVTENLDFRIGGRGDEYDDVGGMGAWSLGAEFRPIDVVAVRGSWSAGQRAPSMLDLYSSEVQGHPYIECDPGSGPPPRTCTELNSRQVTRVTKGNPELDPSDTERFAIGAEARQGPLFADVEWYRLSRSGLPGQNSADWAMQNLYECMDGVYANCIERTGGDITIHDSYANVVENGLSGVNARLGWGFRTDWGIVGLRAAWRHVTDAELRIAGEEDRLAIPKNIIRVGLRAWRGGLSATWTANYRTGYENRTGTGEFESWIGHDVVVDWDEPLGLEEARFTAGVFNITDAGLSVNTANPHSVDGPTEADWGRTFFLTFNMQF